MQECRALQDILSLYENALGQKLNAEKTSLFFSSNTPEATKQEIQNALGVQNMNQLEKYLGLPPLIGRSKRKAFDEIKNKVRKKMGGVERKTPLLGRERSPYKGSGSGHPHLCHECVQVTQFSVFINQFHA